MYKSMKKQRIILAAGLLFGFAVSAQQITNQSNTVDQSYSLFQTNSPTNTYGNRWDILWLTKNELHIRTPKMFMDSTVGKSLTLTAHPKMSWIDETTGQFKMTIKDSIHWPWDHIVGRPDMSLYYLNSNPSSFISTETDPTVSASIKAITPTNISNWNTAFGWGDHSTQGYLKGIGVISQYFRGDGSLATLPVYNAGTGISLASGVFTNIMPDQTVSITGSGTASVTSSYPNFTVNVPSVSENTLTGIGSATVTGSSPSYTINTPVSITPTLSVVNATLSGTYPTQTLTVSAPNTSSTTIITGSIGISVSGSAPNYTITNLLPNITPTLTAINGLSVTSSGSTYTLTQKRQETYSGSTNSSGLYTISYVTAYSVTPNVQFQIGTGGNNKETILLTSSTTTGFTVYVQLRADVLGLLPTYSNVNGRNVDILVTEK